MTNYIPHHRKKKVILEKREKELESKIVDRASDERLSKAAENVREAKIRVINAKLAQLRPDGEGKKQIEKAKIDIEKLHEISVDEIIEQYKVKNT